MEAGTGSDNTGSAAHPWQTSVSSPTYPHDFHSRAHSMSHAKLQDLRTIGAPEAFEGEKARLCAAAGIRSRGRG